MRPSHPPERDAAVAEWARTERVVEYVEYLVPTGPLGGAWNQLPQAINAAVAELRGERAPDWEPYDDAIRVFPLDDAVVLRFEKPTT